MATTLSTFLVGIGLDFKQDDVKQVNSGLDSIKRTALQAGAAVAGAFGAKAITVDTSNRVRQYSLLAEQIDTTAEAVSGLDIAYQRAGGGAGVIISQLEQLKQLQAGLQVGDVGWIERVSRAGIDSSGIMNISDPTEIFTNIIGQLEGMSTNQRINAINAIGLDPTAINLAEDGLSSLQAQIEKAIDRRGISSELELMSEEFSTGWFDMWQNVSSITDKAGTEIIPAVNEIIGSVNSFFDNNTEQIDSGIGMVFGEIADNMELVAIAAASLAASGIGGTLSVMASKLPVIGGAAGGVGAVAKNLGLIGVAASVSGYGAKKVDEFGQGFDLYNDADAAFTSALYELTGIDLSRGGVNSGAPTTITPEQTSSLTAPVISAQDSPIYDRGQTGYSPYGVQSKSRPIVNNIYLEGRMIKQVVNDAMEEQSEQTRKDLKSPLVN